MKYTVTVKAVYVDEMDVFASDEDEARRIAIADFKPCGDNLFSLDVYGLDPWRPIDGREDYEYEQHRQRELDGLL